MQIDEINFNPSSEEILKKFEKSKVIAEDSFKRIADTSNSKRSLKNTLLAFETALSDFSDSLGPYIFLQNVSTNSEVRDASQKITEDFLKYMIEIFLREELYKSIIKFKGDKSIKGDEAKVLKKLLRAFKLNGLDLRQEKRANLRKINEELSSLELQFRRNIAEYKDWLDLIPDRLNGLPKDYIDGLKKTKEGKYRITLDYPSYFGFMRQAEDEDSRKKLYFKFENRASDKNPSILKRIIELRHQSSKLLGYPTYATMVLEDEMAKKPKNVSLLLDSIYGPMRSKADGEINDLLKIKKENNPSANKINAWDFAFYDTLLLKSKFNIDQEKIKEFFPVGKVVSGTLQLYEKLLSIKISEINTNIKWHEDVTLYSVYDKSTNKIMGYFYLDLFPRDGKYNHAGAFRFVDGRVLKDGTHQRSITAMVCNFPKPSKERPALLRHSDVETFFHEFGHLIHYILNQARYGSINSTNGVSMDFSEAPSQMLENWMWEHQSLEFVSAHYKTGENLPKEILNRMIEAKKLCGVHYVRQIFFAKFDQELHHKNIDPDKLYDSLFEKLVPFPNILGLNRASSFGHLVGYDAKYYSYLWSEIYAKDMFSRFKKEGILNPKVGMDYRKFILEPVILYEERKQVEKFLGRKSNDKAFLKSLDLN